MAVRLYVRFERELRARNGDAPLWRILDADRAARERILAAYPERPLPTHDEVREYLLSMNPEDRDQLGLDSRTIQGIVTGKRKPNARTREKFVDQIGTPPAGSLLAVHGETSTMVAKYAQETQEVEGGDPLDFTSELEQLDRVIDTLSYTSEKTAVWLRSLDQKWPSRVTPASVRQARHRARQQP
jgi:hypothetical protein